MKREIYRTFLEAQTLDFANPNDWYIYRQSLNYLSPPLIRSLLKNEEHCSVIPQRSGKDFLITMPTEALKDEWYINELCKVLKNLKSDPVFEIINAKFNKNGQIEEYSFAKDNTIFTSRDLEYVVKGVKKLNDAGFKKVVLQDGMSINKVVSANIKLQAWADEINESTFHGRPLTPLEKYLFAYKAVTQFEYSEDSNNASLSRNSSKILYSGPDAVHVVCIGYAQLLSELCRKIGIPCAVQKVHALQRKSHHACVMVYINDNKYHINGAYIADPSLDSQKFSTKAKNIYSLLELHEAESMYNSDTLHIVEPEQTFAYLSSLPYNVMRKEKFATRDTEKEVENISFTPMDFENLTNSSYDLSEVMTADMVVNHVLNPTLPPDTLVKRMHQDYTHDNM